MLEDADLTKELNDIHEGQQKSLAENLKEVYELANEAYAAKLTATSFENKSKDLKNKLSALMETAGVDKISAQDCSVSGKMKASATVPKPDGDKVKLFAYLADLDAETKDGSYQEIAAVLFKYPTLLSMLTINATSFNSWYAKEQQAKIDQGDVDWALPFISTYEYYSVGFRKKAAPKV